VCRGSGSSERLDGGGRGYALVVTSTATGDVGGADCDLGGGVRGGGKSIGTLGREDGASGRGDADSDDSTFEWDNPSSRLGDPGRSGS
jgi:hypothetical protein